MQKEKVKNYYGENELSLSMVASIMKIIRKIILYFLILEIGILHIGIVDAKSDDNQTNIAKQKEIKEFIKYQKTVEEFLHAWKNRKYEDMYQCMSHDGEPSNEEFIKRYEEYEKKGIELISYKFFPPIKGGEKERQTFKAKLRFKKEILPEITSGIYNIEMVNKNGDWKIESIKKPTPPPSDILKKPTSSHPGEF